MRKEYEFQIVGKGAASFRRAVSSGRVGRDDEVSVDGTKYTLDYRGKGLTLTIRGTNIRFSLDKAVAKKPWEICFDEPREVSSWDGS